MAAKASMRHTNIEEAANLLFSTMILGDDRDIDQTWIMGECAYHK